MRRRRPARRALALATGLLLLLPAVLAARPARAQPLLSQPAEAYRTPQRWAMEVRFGPYAPNIDDEFNGAKHPHRDYFGSKHSLMTQLELDYQLFRGFGSAAVGISLGYFKESAKAPITASTTGARSDDSTDISLFPFAVLGIYRADQMFRHWDLPLVPFAKVGLNYTLWNVYNGNDEVARAGNGRGRGGTLGWQAAVGLALVLDFIDRGAARALDSETGINHTSVFAELAHFDVSGLGRSKQLHVGDTTWLAGLLFEF